MRKIIFIITFLLCFLLYSQTNIYNPGNIYSPTIETVLSTPQTLTDTWADVGGEIDVRGYYGFRLWSTFTMNTSTDIQVRILAKHTTGGIEYQEIILTIEPARVFGYPETFILFDNSITAWSIDFETNRRVYFIQIQIKAHPGDTPGTINSVIITKG